MKISRHLQRKIKFLNKSYDSQDYELLQDLGTIENYSNFYSKKINNQKYKDCFLSKRKEDKKLEYILEGKIYDKYFEDRNLPDLTKINIEIHIDELDDEDYLYSRYGYNLKTQSFLFSSFNEDCNKCKFDSFCKEVRI